MTCAGLRPPTACGHRLGHAADKSAHSSHAWSARIYHPHVPDAGAELRVRLKSPRCRLGCTTAVEQEVARADDESACQSCRTDGPAQQSAAVAAPKRRRVALRADGGRRRRRGRATSPTSLSTSHIANAPITRATSPYLSCTDEGGRSTDLHPPPPQTWEGESCFGRGWTCGCGCCLSARGLRCLSGLSCCCAVVFQNAGQRHWRWELQIELWARRWALQC